MHAAIQECCCITRNVETLVDSSQSLFLWTLRRQILAIHQEACVLEGCDGWKVHRVERSVG